MAAYTFLINADYSGKFIEKPAKLFKEKEKQFLKSLELWAVNFYDYDYICKI